MVFLASFLRVGVFIVAMDVRGSVSRGDELHHVSCSFHVACVQEFNRVHCQWKENVCDEHGRKANGHEEECAVQRAVVI